MNKIFDRRSFWAKHFSHQFLKYPKEPAKALDFSNETLMNQVHDIIIEALKNENCKIILDGGTGLGCLIEKIESKCKSSDDEIEIYGIDISFEMLRRASRKHYGASISAVFFIMDLTSTGFKDNCFDCCICSESLQYTEPFLALTELIRISNRLLIISVPNYYDPIIQRAIKRNNENYEGIIIEQLIEFITNHDRFKMMEIYPLIFAKNQNCNPYKKMDYFEYDKLSSDHQKKANRFVLKLKLQ